MSFLPELRHFLSLQEEQPTYFSTNIGNCHIENYQLNIEILIWKDKMKFSNLSLKFMSGIKPNLLADEVKEIGKHYFFARYCPLQWHSVNNFYNNVKDCKLLIWDGSYLANGKESTINRALGGSTYPS